MSATVFLFLYIQVTNKQATKLLYLQYAVLSAVSPDNLWIQNMQKSLSPTRR